MKSPRFNVFGVVKSSGGSNSNRGPTRSQSTTTTTPATTAPTTAPPATPTITPPPATTEDGSEGECEWDFESMTKSLEGHSAYKDPSLREMRILQYLHQRTGTLKRHVFVQGAAPEDPRPLEDIIEIDAELEKIRYTFNLILFPPRSPSFPFFLPFLSFLLLRILFFASRFVCFSFCLPCQPIFTTMLFIFCTTRQ